MRPTLKDRPERRSTEPRRPGLPGLGLYRLVLRLYPRSFRDEFGTEMERTFVDMCRGPRRGLAQLIARDLLVSLAREHGSSMTSSSLVAVPVVFVVTAVALAVTLSGGIVWVLEPLVTLFILPTTSFTRLRHAWRHRGTGRRLAPSILLGIGLLAPGAVTVARSGESRAWLLVMAGGLALIAGAVVGVIWAAEVFVAARRAGGDPRRSRRARLVLGSAVLVVLAIAAAGYNSYRESQPPPGDHSVANASDESRALWLAAYDGDVGGVERLLAACADPFVQFSDGGLTQFRARSAADHQRGGWGNAEPVPAHERPDYDRIVAMLQAGEDTWTERCNADGSR